MSLTNSCYYDDDNEGQSFQLAEELSNAILVSIIRFSYSPYDFAVLLSVSRKWEGDK